MDIKLRADQYHQILYWFTVLLDSIDNYDVISLEKVKEISDKNESVIDYFISLCKETDRENIIIKLVGLDSYIPELMKDELISLKEYLDIIITEDLDANIQNSFGTKNNGLAHAIATVISRADG